jgi:hypothetical protein
MDKVSFSAQPITTYSHDLSSAVVYTVGPGDVLSKIILKFYNVTPYSSQYFLAVKYLLYFNQEIKNPDAIYPGQHLYLVPLTSTAVCPIEEDSPQETMDSIITSIPTLKSNYYSPSYSYFKTISLNMPSDPDERESFRVMALLENNYNLISTPPGVGLGVLGHITSQQNSAFIHKVEQLYQQYKSGMISKNQYNYRRRLALKEYAKQLGPFEKILYKGQSANEAIRINRSKALPANYKIAEQANRLKRLASLSKHGGVVLMGAGMYVGCQQIAHTSSIKEKNEILVETVGSTAAGVASGIAVSIIFGSNPVGWGLAIVLSVGSAAFSYGIGKASRHAYDTNFNNVNLVHTSGIDQLCR